MQAYDEHTTHINIKINCAIVHHT